MSNEKYYVPHGTYWPIIGSIGISTLFVGFANQMHDVSWGWPVMVLGFAIIAFMMFGWLGTVVAESVGGLYNSQVDKSFRWGMSWFIFSEVMFFAAFFGALFYIRVLAVPWIGGEGARGPSDMLWPDYVPEWPLINTPDPSLFPGAKEPMGPWGLPLINTVLLVISSFTVNIAHHGIKENNRKKIVTWLSITVALGVAFLFCQAYEYYHAYEALGLTLNAGIYGTTFYMLTGFHGAHVTLGTFMLAVMLGRAIKGHFRDDDCFGFEAAAWYWHFVDVVWIGLFVFVYIFGS